MSLINPTIALPANPATPWGYHLVSYEQPNIELLMQNFTNQAKTVCIGGGIARAAIVQNFANVFTNPNFEQAGIGWTLGAGWVASVGSASYIVPAVPDTSSTIGQTINGLTVGRSYRIKVRVEFNTPFTGNLNIFSPAVVVPLVAVESFEYDGVVVPTTSIGQFLGVSFDSVLPTGAGTQIRLRGIDVLDNNNPNTKYYDFFNSYIVSRPVRMTNTRLLFQDASQALLPMQYVRDSITGNTQQEPIPLQLYINPYYVPVWNVLDMKNLLYTLDGMQYLEFTIPALSYTIWSADVVAEVRPMGA